MGYLLLFSILWVWPVPVNATLEARFPGVSQETWFAAWLLLYMAGYLVLRLILLYAMPRLIGVRQDEWRIRLADLERKLQPPFMGWFDVTLETILILVSLYLFLDNHGSTGTRVVVTVACLAYGIALLRNWRAVHTPGPVINLTAIPGPGACQVSLSWNNPPDPGFAGVSVRRGRDSTGGTHTWQEVYHGHSESCRDEDCEAGATYQYAVFCLNGRGSLTNHTICAGATFSLPPDPLHIVTRSADHDIELQWELPAAEQGGLPVQGTLVHRRIDHTPTSSCDGEEVYHGEQAWCRDIDLQPATVYYYRLFSFDVSGQTSPGISVQVPTQAPSVTALRIWIERGRVRMAWRNPAGPEPELIIVRKVGADPQARDDGDVFETHGTSWMDETAEVSTTYHYGVYTRYPGAVYGEGRFSRITTPPPAPLIENFEASAERTRVEVRWRWPVAPGLGGVHIRRTRNGSAPSPEAGEFVYEGRERNQIVNGNLEPDTEYVYTAFSYDNSAPPRYNPRSLSIAVHTVPGPQPVVLNLPQVEATARQIILMWTRGDATAPYVHLRRWENNAPASTSYAEPGGNLLCQGEEVRYVDKDLMPGHIYYYVAYAVDRDGCASVGVMREVHTPPSWNITVRLIDQVASEQHQVSLPESIPLDRVLSELLRRFGRGEVTHIRLHNGSRNYDYRLDASLHDQGTQPGDELVLDYARVQN